MGNDLVGIVPFEQGELSEAFSLIMKTTLSTKHREFQYRLIHRILVTNVKLKMWKLRDSDLCSFCNEHTETTTHLMWDCTHIQELWLKLFNWIKNETSQNIRFTKKEVLLGIFFLKI